MMPKDVLGKKTATNLAHGFTDDPQSVPADACQTAVQKNAKLELVLDRIANFATIISRNTIVKMLLH